MSLNLCILFSPSFIGIDFVGSKLEFLHELNLISILIRVTLALVIGGILGMERGRKSQPAGFRTYMLVCLSSAMVMMTNQYIVQITGSGDPARLGAQVVSGIGFLGAGTIIVTRRNQVRGLTTAAGLWSSACLGLAIGIGFYIGAIVVGIAVLLIMTIFHKIDNWFTSNNKVINIYASFSSIEYFDVFIEKCNTLGLRVRDIEINKSPLNDEKNSVVVSIVNLESKKRFRHSDIIHKFSSIEGLRQIEEL